MANERGVFNTLRGRLTGDEPDESPYIHSSATLRIFGCEPSFRPHNAPDDAVVSLDFAEIESRLGVAATRHFRQGETRAGARIQRCDVWFYESSLAEDRPLSEHVDAVWAAVRAGADFLRTLKETVSVSVFLGYRSNDDKAGVVVPHASLEMFTTLEVPFELSIIVT